MGKIKHRKQKPSMPYWWWLDVDGCWFCKNQNNCGNCKAAKKNIKEKRRRDKRKLNKYNNEGDYGE